MKAKEKAEVIKLITEKIRKRGMPINILTGSNEDLAGWMEKLLKELLPIEEPTGVQQGIDYDYCPACGAVVGNSAYYCKICGTYLREVENEAGN